MENGFRDFMQFVCEVTGQFPEKIAASFHDIFIYIPNDKIPPKTNYFASNQPRRTICIKSYFSNRNDDFRQLVYNEDWNDLEIYLGPELLRFCLAECIFAKRTKADGFMISNWSALSAKIVTEPPSQMLNKIFYETAVYCQERSNKTSAVVLDKDKQQIWDVFCPKNIEISTDDILFKTCRICRFSDSHVLVKKNTVTTLSSQVINTQVGDCQIVEYEDCVEPLELILKKLKKSHNKYNYEKALSQLITTKAEDNCVEKKGEHENSGNALPLPVLKMYFTRICGSVIPKNLFGSNKNINTVVKIICDLLETPKYQSISLKPYIQKMRVSEMSWLDGVKNVESKYFILGKLLKWLFKIFILEIFRTQFYIMVTNTYQKIYFRQKDWQKLTTQFCKKMSRDGVIVRTDGLHTNTTRDGRWILFPKKNGVRPIMSPIKGQKPEEVTKMALCYLQQLYMTKYGQSGQQVFLEEWRDLVDKFRNDENKTIYLVCCDIEYAYGSIVQKKLMKIVESLADSAPGELRFKNYKIARNLKAVKSGFSTLKKCVKYPELELPILAKSIFACGDGEAGRVSRETLLHEIRRNVLNQNILVSNQRYLLQEGIAQGAILSSVLCDIYYAQMEEENLSQFKDKGFLYRYVDDFLFVTEDKASAEGFLQRINNGFPEYNCSFNAAKTRTNLPGHERNTKHITYLGFDIDSTTLEVKSEYSKSPRYTTMLSKPSYKVIKTFCKRLSNLASLKLDGIVLDCKINSEDTIIENIKCAFMRQAERCLWLIRAMIDDIPGQLGEIFGIIRSTNIQIIKRVQRYFLANGYDFEKLVSRLLVIPWKSYRQVFGKKPEVHIHFRSLFLDCIRMSNDKVAHQIH